MARTSVSYSRWARFSNEELDLLCPLINRALAATQAQGDIKAVATTLSWLHLMKLQIEREKRRRRNG